MIAQVLGTEIYYETQGVGLPVMFFHGLGGTSNIWHGQRLVLSKFFQVITVDLPGSGRSAKSERVYSMERWVEQIDGLANALGLGHFVLVGHSMTTVLAQKYAATQGGRLKGLVLCGPLTELTPEARDNFGKRAELVAKEGMVAVADTVLGGWLTPATLAGGNAPLAGLLRDMLQSNDPTCYAGHCQALRTGSARPDQARIACPTLILVGDQDFVTPLANCQAIAAAIAKAQIKIIPQTAHMTMLERPEVVNTVLGEFLLGLN